MTKEKYIYNDPHNTKKKTKDRATRTPQNTTEWMRKEWDCDYLNLNQMQLN
jgi:hypothetical protein